MTALRIKKIVFHSVYAVVCLIIILLQSTGLLPLKIYTASAVLIIPASIYAGFYFGWLPGAIFGFGSVLQRCGADCLRPCVRRFDGSSFQPQYSRRMRS